MKSVVRLLRGLGSSTTKTERHEALVDYFNGVESAEADLAISFMFGRRVSKVISSAQLESLCFEVSGIPDWLFKECRSVTSDLAETVALLITPEIRLGGCQPFVDVVLNELSTLRAMSSTARDESIKRLWCSLDADERFLFNKLLLGQFRIKVDREDLLGAFQRLSGLPKPLLSRRLETGIQHESYSFQELINPEFDSSEICLPYSFPIWEEVSLTNWNDSWLNGSDAYWYHGGTRVQIVKRNLDVAIWTENGFLDQSLIGSFHRFLSSLPDDTVIAAEIRRNSNPGPVSPASAMEFDQRAQLWLNDCLEASGTELRSQPPEDRFSQLTEIAGKAFRGGIEFVHVADRLNLRSKEDAQSLLSIPNNDGKVGISLHYCEQDPTMGARNILLRTSGDTLKGILMYAERAEDKGYKSYSFGVWDNEIIVPIAKLELPWTSAEVAELDAFIRGNVSRRIGPIHEVPPEVVVEIEFFGIEISPRRKAGIVLRDPRVLTWRRDLAPEDANSLQWLKGRTPL